MPYYVGAGDPEWDKYIELVETETIGDPPRSFFKYIEPLQTTSTILPFPETPGPKPEGPPSGSFDQSRPFKPTLLARLFGAKARPAVEPPTPGSKDWFAQYQKAEKALALLSLWQVSGSTARFRALGVKRIFGSYDGGSDESFVYLRGVEMNDGRLLAPDLLEGKVRKQECEAIASMAVSAIMGRFDAGEFLLHGAVTIDFEACTITDEKDADVVFGEKDWFFS